MLIRKRLKYLALTPGQYPLLVLVVWLLSGGKNLAVAADEKTAETETGQEEQHLQLAPIRVNSGLQGNVGYSFSRMNSGTSQTTQQALNLGMFYDLGVRTFILQPWIAQVSSNVRAGFINSKSNSSSMGRTGMATTLVTGDAILEVVKKSRFPFTARVFREVDDSSGSFTNLANSSRHGYALSQAYQNRRKSFISSLAFNHIIEDRAGNPESSKNELDYDSTLNLSPFQSLWLTGSTIKQYINATSDTSTSNTSLRHLYQPNNAFSVGSLLNILSTSYTYYPQTGPSQHNGLDSQQLNTLASWRPEKSPLTVTSSMRLLKFDSNFYNTGSYTTSNFNLGANYLFSPFIRMYGSINVGDASGIQLTTTNVALSASKSANLKRAIKADDWRYTTYIGGSLSSSQNTSSSPAQNSTKSSQGIGVSLGHQLDKTSTTQKGNFTTNLHQMISTIARNTGALMTKLTTGGSWTLNEQPEARVNTYLRLSANDARSLSGDRDFFQVINLQGGRDETLPRHQTLRGNITCQVTRGGSDVSPTTRTPLTPIATMAYKNLRTMGIRNLTFDSILSASTINSALNQAYSSQGQTTLTESWENNLRYHIGRTQVMLLTKFMKSGNTPLSSIWFSVNRQF